MEEEDRMKQDARVRAAQGPRALGCAAVAGTVAGSRLDPAHSVIGQRQWEGIHDRHAAGQSVSAIARDLELDRKTVRSCLRQLAWQPYRREVTASKKLDEHMDWLVQRAPQVHYSARVLHQELRTQRGFTGCYETAKLAVRWRRQLHSSAPPENDELRYENDDNDYQPVRKSGQPERNQLEPNAVCIDLIGR